MFVKFVLIALVSGLLISVLTGFLVKAPGAIIEIDLWGWPLYWRQAHFQLGTFVIWDNLTIDTLFWAAPSALVIVTSELLRRYGHAGNGGGDRPLSHVQ